VSVHFWLPKLLCHLEVVVTAGEGYGRDGAVVPGSLGGLWESICIAGRDKHQQTQSKLTNLQSGMRARGHGHSTFFHCQDLPPKHFGDTLIVAYQTARPQNGITTPPKPTAAILTSPTRNRSSWSYKTHTNHGNRPVTSQWPATGGTNGNPQSRSESIWVRESYIDLLEVKWEQTADTNGGSEPAGLVTPQHYTAVGRPRWRPSPNLSVYRNTVLARYAPTVAA